MKTEEYKVIISTLKSQAEYTNDFALRQKREFDDHADAYRNAINANIQRDAIDILSESDKFVKDFDDLITQFEQNVEKKPKFLQKTSIPTRLFFNREKMDVLQKIIDASFECITSKIRYVKDRESLYKDYERYDFAKEGFNILPTDLALVKLREQVLEIRKLEFIIFRYFVERHTDFIKCFNVEHISLFPNRPTARVGEPFEVGMAISIYSSQHLEPYYNYYINDKKIKSKEGLATFSKTYNTPGLKRIKAKLEVNNPLTNTTRTIISEYSFEVLPKR